LTLRPQLHIVAGRMFKPGSNEIVAGRSIAERFDGAAWASRCASAGATGWWWVYSTPARAVSIPRSGAMSTS